MPNDPLDAVLPPSLQGTQVEETPFNQADEITQQEQKYDDITHFTPEDLVPKKAVPEQEQMVGAQEGWTFVKYLFSQKIVIPWPAEEHEDSKVAYFEIPPSLEQLFEKVFITSAQGSPKIRRINEETGQLETWPEYENKGVPGLVFAPHKYTCLPNAVAELFFQHGGAIFLDAGRRVAESELARSVPRRSDAGFYLDEKKI